MPSPLQSAWLDRSALCRRRRNGWKSAVMFWQLQSSLPAPLPRSWWAGLLQLLRRCLESGVDRSGLCALQGPVAPASLGGSDDHSGPKGSSAARLGKPNTAAAENATQRSAAPSRRRKTKRSESVSSPRHAFQRALASSVNRCAPSPRSCSARSPKTPER
jgi:hypothetical protein